MGLDLRLYPLKDAKSLVGNVLAWNRLQFERDYRIFAQIADVDGKSKVPEEELAVVVRTQSLPPSVQVGLYEDEGLIDTTQDAYGKEMTYALAGDLRKIRLLEPVFPTNGAIMAYVRALPKNTPIILDWA